MCGCRTYNGHYNSGRIRVNNNCGSKCAAHSNSAGMQEWENSITCNHGSNTRPTPERVGGLWAIIMRIRLEHMYNACTSVDLTHHIIVTLSQAQHYKSQMYRSIHTFLQTYISPTLINPPDHTNCIDYNQHAVDEVDFMVIVLCKECEGYILTHMHMSICIHKHKEA